MQTTGKRIINKAKTASTRKGRLAERILSEKISVEILWMDEQFQANMQRAGYMLKEGIISKTSEGLISKIECSGQKS